MPEVDYFETHERIGDRLEALRRTLNDPNLSQEAKVEELFLATARIRYLEDTRPMALALSAIADLAAIPRGDA